MPLRLEAPGRLHRRAVGRAARLGIKREERHGFIRKAIEVGGRHAAAWAAAIGARVPVSEIMAAARLRMFGKSADRSFSGCPSTTTKDNFSLVVSLRAKNLARASQLRRSVLLRADRVGRALNKGLKLRDVLL